VFESFKEPLLPKAKYYLRLLYHVATAVGIIAGSLLMGVLGYHFLEGQPWLDAILNAAMILGGMGPVNALHTPAGKLFAAAYALFSGVIFLVIAGILFAPAVHRFLHKHNIQLEADDAASKEDR
jgi:hypothetical protein